MTTNPLVSVILPVLNCEKYLAEAIESILNQTYTNFEFLIIDSGSTDDTRKIISEFKDTRIKLIYDDEKSGVAAAMNKGISFARGKYLARMDCDDICFSEKIARQVLFMEKNLGVDVCGSYIQLFGERENVVVKYPLTDNEIKTELFFSCPFANSTTILRASTLKQHKLLFDPFYKIAEDYNFWVSNKKLLTYANIPEVLLKYRVSTTSLFNSNIKDIKKYHRRIYEKNLSYLGIELTDELYDVFDSLINLDGKTENKGFILQVQSLAELIARKNLLYKEFPEPTFTTTLANHWYYLCYKSKRQYGFWSWRIFKRSFLSKNTTISLLDKLLFFGKAVYFQLVKITTKRKEWKKLSKKYCSSCSRRVLLFYVEIGIEILCLSCYDQLPEFSKKGCEEKDV